MVVVASSRCCVSDDPIALITDDFALHEIVEHSVEFLELVLGDLLSSEELVNLFLELVKQVSEKSSGHVFALQVFLLEFFDNCVT